MAVHCLAWIPHMWAHLVDLFNIRRKEVINPFPDDVIVEILLRLPAEHVVKCRNVCRQWRAITSTSYFTELHLKRATPTLLVQSDFLVAYGNESKLFICEEAAEKETTYSKIRMTSMKKEMQYGPVLIGSCNGLLLFKATLKLNTYFITNPITKELIGLFPPMKQGYICGIFFHPFTRDYKLLFCHHLGDCYQYFIYSIRAKKWREITTFSYRPASSAPPAIFNGYLHWLVSNTCYNAFDSHPCTNAILAFSINDEDFHVLPHPGYQCPSEQQHKRMNLFEMKEQLTFCYMCLNSLVVDIWVLEDYGNWDWVKRNVICLEWMNKLYPSKNFFDYLFPYSIKLLNIQNDELLLDWCSKGLFRYHLKLSIAREITSGMGLSRVVEHECRTFAYTKSLVELNVLPCRRM